MFGCHNFGNQNDQVLCQDDPFDERSLLVMVLDPRIIEKNIFGFRKICAINLIFQFLIDFLLLKGT
jgi:hypothetical protein